ncbi:ATP-binding protein [Streptomyces sp. BHT-5-2]|uniref:ATP-binding protein n=2 Tax=Streptomyces TaxID=1883 RepID=UPI001C8D8E57|nr:ATP-binding protein [Streptomyces sp. BHT-5-2]QZL06823.1 ATP-binding protein [Streptomyces sp. BHT-5-2]
MMGDMAGLDGTEQPRPRSGAAPHWETPGAGGETTPAPVAPAPAARPPGGPDLVGDPTLGEVRLPSRPQSARTARRLTAAILLRQWSLSPQLAEHSVLLVSELVGNAVRHTGARTFGLRILRRRGWIRVEVRDPSRGLPCLMPVQPMDVSGRGLFLVDKLSDRWGVDLLPRGKTTWFEIRVGDR